MMWLNLGLYFLGHTAMMWASRQEIMAKSRVDRPFYDMPFKIVGALSFICMIIATVFGVIEFGWGWGIGLNFAAAITCPFWVVALRKFDGVQQCFLLFILGLLFYAGTFLLNLSEF